MHEFVNTRYIQKIRKSCINHLAGEEPIQAARDGYFLRPIEFGSNLNLKKMDLISDPNPKTQIRPIDSDPRPIP